MLVNVPIEYQALFPWDSVSFAPPDAVLLLLLLFIGVLGRSDCRGHYAPITQVNSSTQGVYHREFYV